MAMRVRCQRGVWLGVLLVAALLLVADRVGAGTLDVTWNAPTTNADGTPLTDLANYRVYIGTPCPGDGYRSVASATPAPPSGSVVAYAAVGLLAGTIYATQVTALDDAGNESACSGSASGVARLGFTVSPAGSVAFGSVPVGGAVDRTFTVQNVGSTTLTGTATAPNPFSVVSGASFSVSPGNTSAVVVRFQPTATGDVAANVTLRADGDSVSRGLNGSGAGASTATVTVTRTGNGTVNSSPAGISCGTTCSGLFPTGAPVTLTAAPASGSTFSGWSGACTGTATCTVTPNANVSVSATFAAITNPAPTLGTLSPASTTAGGAGVTLTVNGTSFVSSSVVRWNGSARATTYVSATQLRATIGAGDVAAVGTAQVTVLTPSPGGGTSAGLPFAITAAPNPAPIVGALSPASTTAGSAGFTLTVTGANFMSSSVVRWSGNALATTYVSATQLRATIAADAVAAAGLAEVAVATPAPGGGTSGALSFAITPRTAAEIIVDNARPGVQDPAGGRTFTGRWCRSNSRNAFGPSALYSCRSTHATYRWTADIPVTGTYEVSVWVGTHKNHSTAVPVSVVHASGKAIRTVNQRSGGGTWVVHGVYTFNAGRTGYVEVSNDNGIAGADAVRWVLVP
jgi:hypothetical protein